MKADRGDLVERLRDTGQLPLCPYDRRSPDYWTTPDDQPCVVCGQLNDPNAPILCRGADTSLFGQAATLIEDQGKEIERLKATMRAPSPSGTAPLPMGMPSPPRPSSPLSLEVRRMGEVTLFIGLFALVATLTFAWVVREALSNDR